MKTIISENHRLTVKEVAEEVGISIGSCHTILTQDLGMHRVPAKFVPRLLPDDLLLKANDDEDVLKNAITGDEMWVYGYDIET
jgi:AraC-like DNA-binding protein